MIRSVTFLSNTVTQPFERFLSAYELSHAPLDTIIEQLYADEIAQNDLIIILLDKHFYRGDYEQRFEVLKNALLHFRSKHATPIILNTIIDDIYAFHTPSAYVREEALFNLNKRIVHLQNDLLNVAVLDLYALSRHHGVKNLFNDKNGYLFQSPYTRLALELIAQNIEELITLFSTPRIKAIAIDADNTLWGGIVGEDGVEGIAIDQNYPGIAYHRFQQDLLALRQSGIVLILLSKNDEEAVLEVFEKRSMPLSLSDFVATAVNWNAKSDNLKAILEELNLSTSGIIFLDDSPSEIEQMRQMLGIPSFAMNPQNPLENSALLRSIVSLKSVRLTQEDLQKTALYQEEKARTALEAKTTSKEEFIASLDIRMHVFLNHEAHLERIAQLINKTNQFNLTTKRYDVGHVHALMKDASVYDFSVQDTFGDMGIVGVLIVKEGCIDTFLMSCRVLGRGIEEAVLAFVTRRHPNLRASYIPSAKNRLVENFYEKNGFILESTDANGVKTYRCETLRESHFAIKVNYES